MEYVFWLLIGLCVYGYVGYPLFLAILAVFWPKQQPETDPVDCEPTEFVSILIAAFNEEDNIGKKLESLMAQDYPPALFEVWVLNDGSSDATAAIVEAFPDQRVRLLNLPRGGKATALNRGVAMSRGAIIVFSDADIVWQQATLRNLVAPFRHETTGAVAGCLKIDRQVGHLGHGDKIYRRYEAAIRTWETRIASAVSADGALFAIRRCHWQELPLDVTDDFFISTGAVVDGKKIVFAPDAVAFDSGVEKAKSQLNRRVRITVRGLTSLWRRRTLFDPLRHGLYAFFLFSHKLVRRLVPAFGLLLLPVNGALVGDGLFYLLTFICQLGVYAVAFAGLLNRGGKLPRIFSLVGFVVLNCCGVFSGLIQFLGGKRFTFWTPDQNR